MAYISPIIKSILMLRFFFGRHYLNTVKSLFFEGS